MFSSLPDCHFLLILASRLCKRKVQKCFSLNWVGDLLGPQWLLVTSAWVATLLGSGWRAGAAMRHNWPDSNWRHWADVILGTSKAITQWSVLKWSFVKLLLPGPVPLLSLPLSSLPLPDWKEAQKTKKKKKVKDILVANAEPLKSLYATMGARRDFKHIWLCHGFCFLSKSLPFQTPSLPHE